MSAFEYVFGLMSVMSSLALTQLLSGTVRVVRANGVRAITIVDALWVWIAFATTIGNWGAYWAQRDFQNWTALLVLLNLAMMVDQYIFCELAVPEASAAPKGQADPGMRTRRPAMIAFLVLGPIAIAGNILSASFYSGWLRDSLLSVGLMLITAPLLFLRDQRVQLVGATLIALESAYYIWVTTSIVAA